jgi:hypothetical protein
LRGGAVSNLNSLERGRTRGRRNVTSHQSNVSFDPTNTAVIQHPEARLERVLEYLAPLPGAVLSLKATSRDMVAPFFQRAQLFGPDNSMVRVTEHVDNGSMCNCMSLAR